MNYEIRQYSFGETIGKGFNLYFDNFIRIALVSLLCQAPTILIIYLTGYLNASQDISLIFGAKYLGTMTVLLFLGLVVDGFLSAYIIHLVARKFLVDSPPGRENDTISILPYLFPVIGLSLLVGLIVVMGCIALVVPGIIIALGYSLATEVLVIEKRKVTESMGRSWNLTRGKRWYILGILLVSYLIVFFINQPFLFILKLIGLDNQSATYMNYVVSAITNPILSCISVVVYFNIRIEKEGFNIEHLAGQFTLADPRDSSLEA